MTQAEKWKSQYFAATPKEKFQLLAALPSTAEERFQSVSGLTEPEYTAFDHSLFIFSDGSVVYIRMGVEGKYAPDDLPKDPPVFDDLKALL